MYKGCEKQHYTHAFAKYKNDIRKTWDTLKDIMKKNKSKVEFPTYFLNNGKYVCSPKNIADKFNECFTEIGPSLASEIDVSNKSPFNTYLTSPCTSSFHFQYTNPSGVLKIIQGLKTMTTMASQITSLTVVYSIVYSDADQRKHQSSASLAFVRGIHRDQWIPRTKGQ